MIYDVAQTGAMGNVVQVERVKLYDFMSYYSFMKSQQRYNELGAARIEAKGKSGGGG